MKRRSFLKYSSLLSTPLIIGGIPVSSVARNSMAGMFNDESDRILVLIQLNGGNDGLSTILPMNSYDVLSNVRSNIIVPESSLLNIDNDLALHPSLTGMKSLYDDGKINIIQNVGYPEQNRSHFRSSDIWHSGSSATEFQTTGWLGRYMDSKYPGYPPEYPNTDFPDPFALTIGSAVSETCQGLAGNFSMTLVDPENIGQLGTPVNNEVASGCGGDQLNFLVNAIEKSNDYGERMIEAYEKGNNLSTQYGDANRLSNQLKTVARLISGGLRTKVYVVSLGGFDTHAEQTEDGSPITGNHANLLSLVSEAISAFQDDITQLGVSERVLGMTYSEFGRRIRSNFSFGTDHGDAAPLIVFGNCVNAGVLGTNPEISANVTQDEGVPMEIDFRSIYGSVLIDWFEIDEQDVQNLFTGGFEYIPIASTCEAPSSIFDKSKENITIKAYPNPTSDVSYIEFDSESDWIKISVLNNLGQQIKVVSNQRFAQGSHNIEIDVRDYPAGSYYVQLQSSKFQKSVPLVKI